MQYYWIFNFNQENPILTAEAYLEPWVPDNWFKEELDLESLAQRRRTVLLEEEPSSTMLTTANVSLKDTQFIGTEDTTMTETLICTKENGTEDLIRSELNATNVARSQDLRETKSSQPLAIKLSQATNKTADASEELDLQWTGCNPSKDMRRKATLMIQNISPETSIELSDCTTTRPLKPTKSTIKDSWTDKSQRIEKLN